MLAIREKVMVAVEFKKPASKDGLTATLNRMGYMIDTLDPFREAFVDFSGSAEFPVLEIGAAYGVASLAALANGAYVVANDLDPRHLEILKQTAPKNALCRLELVPGRFPEELHFKENFFSAILISHVLHFLPGELIARSVTLLYKWLRPGGKVFILAATPYTGMFQDFIPTYEERKKAGWEWPGEIGDTSVYTSRSIDLPKFVHPLEIDILEGQLLKNGFMIEETGIFTTPNLPADIRLDGRETIGIIALKPNSPV